MTFINPLYSITKNCPRVLGQGPVLLSDRMWWTRLLVLWLGRCPCCSRLLSRSVVRLTVNLLHLHAAAEIKIRQPGRVNTAEEKEKESCGWKLGKGMEVNRCCHHKKHRLLMLLMVSFSSSHFEPVRRASLALEHQEASPPLELKHRKALLWWIQTKHFVNVTTCH